MVYLPGKTVEERQAWASGYRMGMCAAVSSLRDLAIEAGEDSAAVKSKPYAAAADHVERRVPRGEIVTTHELK